MKNFKKILAFALAALFVLSLTACGKTETTVTDSTAKTATSLTVEEGKLTMATNASFPPYEYYDGDNIVGIDAEIAGLIANKLGLELEIADVEFSSIIPGVQSNKYDMGMAGMTVTDERKEMVNFSDSYAKGVQVVIVKEGSNIASIDDLNGKKIGVQESTTGDIYASSSPEDGGFGEENVTKYASGNLAVEGLKAGKVDCVIIDNEPAKAYVAANEGLKILDTHYADEDYAISFNKNNTELQKKVNEALKELIADGSVEKIVNKYIPAE